VTQSYTLSPRAQLDLKTIKADSLKEWGPEFTKLYLAKIESRLNWLADKPALGKPRDEVGKGFRSYGEGRHIIFYRISNGTERLRSLAYHINDKMLTGSLAD